MKKWLLLLLLIFSFLINISFSQNTQSSMVSKFLHWNPYPGSKWTKLELKNAPFPHPQRKDGFTNSKNELFPYRDHYDDSSAVIVIPKGWHETPEGVNIIVHFHGHRNNVLKVLEKFKLPQQLTSSNKNAILVLAQGPKNAPDSFGGKMEDHNGFKYFIEEILEKLRQDGILQKSNVNKIILSAHSGGYRPAAYVLECGGLTSSISAVFLFDAFYGQHDKFFNWVKNYNGKLISIYTSHLSDEHKSFLLRLEEENIFYSVNLSKNKRLTFYPTNVCHSCVMAGNFETYLRLSNLTDIKK